MNDNNPMKNAFGWLVNTVTGATAMGSKWAHFNQVSAAMKDMLLGMSYKEEVSMTTLVMTSATARIDGGDNLHTGATGVVLVENIQFISAASPVHRIIAFREEGDPALEGWSPNVLWCDPQKIEWRWEPMSRQVREHLVFGPRTP